jgi:hypothetical protein
MPYDCFFFCTSSGITCKKLWTTFAATLVEWAGFFTGFSSGTEKKLEKLGKNYKKIAEVFEKVGWVLLANTLKIIPISIGADMIETAKKDQDKPWVAILFSLLKSLKDLLGLGLVKESKYLFIYLFNKIQKEKHFD